MSLHVSDPWTEREENHSCSSHIAMLLSRGLSAAFEDPMGMIDIIHVFITSVHDPVLCGIVIWLCVQGHAYVNVLVRVCMQVYVCGVIWREGKKNNRHFLLSCMWNCYYPKAFSCWARIWAPHRNSISHRQQNLIKTKTVSTAYLFPVCLSPPLILDCRCLNTNKEWGTYILRLLAGDKRCWT